jgi:hypothetical protein
LGRKNQYIHFYEQKGRKGRRKMREEKRRRKRKTDFISIKVAIGVLRSSFLCLSPL